MAVEYKLTFIRAKSNELGSICSHSVLVCFFIDLFFFFSLWTLRLCPGSPLPTSCHWLLKKYLNHKSITMTYLWNQNKFIALYRLAWTFNIKPNYTLTYHLVINHIVLTDHLSLPKTRSIAYTFFLKWCLCPNPHVSVIMYPFFKICFSYIYINYCSFQKLPNKSQCL